MLKNDSYLKKTPLTKLLNAHFKQPVQQFDCLSPITKFSFIFENIVRLFLPSFKQYNVDGLCLAGLMSYASALK